MKALDVSFRTVPRRALNSFRSPQTNHEGEPGRPQCGTSILERLPVDPSALHRNLLVASQTIRAPSPSPIQAFRTVWGVGADSGWRLDLRRNVTCRAASVDVVATSRVDGLYGTIRPRHARRQRGGTSPMHPWWCVPMGSRPRHSRRRLVPGNWDRWGAVQNGIASASTPCRRPMPPPTCQD